MTDFVVAEAGVRQLHARYVDAVWRKDLTAFGDCFTEACEWRIGGQVHRGRAACVAFVKLQMDITRGLLITLRTPILHVGNGTATGRTYFTARNALINAPPIAPIGMYYEHFVDQGDRWRFAWRLFQSHYSGPPDFSGKFSNNPDYGPPPGMPPRDATA